MAQHRHKRETNARRLPGARLARLRATTLAAPLAVLATTGAVSIGVLGAGVQPVALAGPSSVVGDTAAPAGDLAGVVQRRLTLSRGLAGSTRGATSKPAAKVATKPTPPTKLELLLAPSAVRKAIADATATRWTTDLLNLWSEPGKRASQTGQVAAGKPVVVTGRALYGRVEIVWGAAETRWVTAGYLTDHKPQPVQPTQPVTASSGCTNGTTVPDAVSENIKKVHAAVCAAFPDISVYGTFRGDGEHAQGIAVDIMCSGSENQAVADFVRARAAELGVSYIIHQQQIWSVQRSSEGWRAMEDRGSVTANHYDHVHVTVY